jgi:hypothetical protein
MVLLAVGVLALIAGTFLTSYAVGFAHERRSVGAYNFVVGWLNEPALINQPNAVDLRVSRAADASAVTGLEQTMKVEVTAAEKKTNVDLRPRFNTPGAYDGRLIPTQVGAYSFRFTGTIEGQPVDETFTAGPGTFGLIEEGNAFPNELPTNQELEERIVRLQAVGTDKDDSDTALYVAIAGVVAGALGLVTAGYAITKKG